MRISAEQSQKQQAPAICRHFCLKAFAKVQPQCFQPPAQMALLSDVDVFTHEIRIHTTLEYLPAFIPCYHDPENELHITA